MRHGWFSIPGVQTGDRTVEEQLLGLEPALEACVGKRVLDLGSAEGLISRAFARAGAARVVGIELVFDHLRVARRICHDAPAVSFIQASLQEWIQTHPDPERFDIVLALGVAHKLHDPGQLIDFAARSATELLAFRGPGKDKMYWDGWLESKHTRTRCHVPTILTGHCFQERETHDSAHGERVQYWARAK